MLETPQIMHTTAQLTAVIHVTVPRERMQQVMGPGLTELMSIVAGQGIAPAGPWFTHHFKMAPDTFDFEIGVPVTASIAAAGRVQAGQLPEMRVARTIYRGPYEGLARAWGELDAWIVAQGHVPAADLWECYVRGPESGDEPATWQTELTRPLLD
ncbi:MAG: AraC family transcriptional regulator [Myxococcaceae bacterium]|nr:AraC family transcriptional regulator [Myxococcaceae bacterium]